MTERISAALARRIALAAQGFGEKRPESRLDHRHVGRALARTQLLQIDSVSVLVRAHYLPLFSRLGHYDRGLLERSAWGPKGNKRRLFEYWAHEASLLPLDLHPLLRWRMDRAERGEGIYGGLARFGREQRGYIDRILARIEADGPLAASALDGQKGTGGWWGWSDGKRALEWLFWAGRITTADRRGFERVYDLPERVLPAPVLAAPTPTPADAQRELLRRAGSALGIATAADLRDYFRLDTADAKARLPELVESGDFLPVAVEGWTQPGYLHKEARLPRRIAARALLAPFDPLVWERARTERLFGFRYRLEIYTPAEKRIHGYYVLPFLLGDRLVARVDLKAERAAGRLRVIAAHAEDHAPPETAAALADELDLMAGWLGLDRVGPAEGGDFAAALNDNLSKRTINSMPSCDQNA